MVADFTAEEYEQLGKEAYIPVSQMQMPNLAEYGRLLTAAKLSRMIKNFDWRQFGRPWVSLRQKGVYVIIDGNHRVEAVRKKFGVNTKIPVILYAGLSTEDEAFMFSEAQAAENRTAITPLVTFNARVTAKDKTALEIIRILNLHGVRIGNVGRRGQRDTGIRAVREIQNLHRKGVLGSTLETLITAWGKSTESLSFLTLASIGGFLIDFPKADRARLRQVLKKHSPFELRDAVNAYAKFVAGSNSNRLNGRAVILNWYNARLSDARKLGE